MNIIVEFLLWSINVVIAYFVACLLLFIKTGCSKQAEDLAIDIAKFLEKLLVLAMIVAHMMYLGGY